MSTERNLVDLTVECKSGNGNSATRDGDSRSSYAFEFKVIYNNAKDYRSRLDRLWNQISPTRGDKTEYFIEWYGIIFAFYYDYIPYSTPYPPVGGWKNPISVEKFTEAVGYDDGYRYEDWNVVGRGVVWSQSSGRNVPYLKVGGKSQVEAFLVAGKNASIKEKFVVNDMACV